MPLQFSILWSNLDEQGAERVAVRETDMGWRFRGTVVDPTEVLYDLLCDASWLTQSVHVEVDDNQGLRTLDLSVQGRTWLRDGVALDLGQDVFDVDLSVSPLTNTLPIRRLALAVGESSPVTVAWLRFPNLTVERSEQRYKRVSDFIYRFTAGDLTADLKVDDLGFVVEYPAGWSRAGTSRMQ